MKFTADRESLLEGLKIVSPAVPSRTPKDIIKHVLLEVRERYATLSATDSELSVHHELAGIDPGMFAGFEVLLDPAQVASVLSAMPDASVVFEISPSISRKDGGIHIKGSRSKFKFPWYDPQDFPVTKMIKNPVIYDVEAEALRRLISRTIFACDEKSERYALGGVLVELSADGIKLVATDARRLAIASGVAVCRGAPEAISVIVPANVMDLVVKCMANDDGEIAIAATDKAVEFRSKRTTIYGPTIVGKFPAYRSVVPEGAGDAVVNVVAGPLLSVVRQARIINDRENKQVVFRLENGSLSLLSEAPSIGDSVISHPVDYSGEPIDITFDPKYMSDFLGVVEPEANVEMNLYRQNESGSRPAKIVSGPSTYVVMPVARD